MGVRRARQMRARLDTGREAERVEPVLSLPVRPVTEASPYVSNVFDVTQLGSTQMGLP
ncbi:hypothetical protein GCM10023170_068130 [Phytohabitans houttuyneae]|uniref:Uncharacterized protein n=1 Tax=Phytohabitans houttuyneae TaxID=1076126 RepID=A0A6V8KSJ3_9ACTN|nr:hypothetical protein Phou_095010 [Phytohabitans houttuyneae]